MAKFLVGNELSRTIKEICKGNNVCCAVAFWGDGAEGLFTSKSKPKIICDLSMGGTNPEALKNLGAPKTDNIKHLVGLHAKIYISDKGVVVASANASNNGLGFSNGDSKYGHIEAGSYSRANSKFWNEAKVWFADQWDYAKTVKDIDLKNASYRWSLRSPMPKTLPQENLTVIQALREEPAIFRDMKFVLTNEENNDDIIKEAEAVYLEKEGREAEADECEHFEGWGLKEEAWPEVFMSIHIGPKGGLYVNYYTRGPVYGDIQSEKDVQFSRKADIRESEMIHCRYLSKALSETDEISQKQMKKIVKKARKKHPKGVAIISANELSKLLKKHAPPKGI